MSNKFEELEGLGVPDEQIGRQAVDCLRGYIYQIYQSLTEWIKLKENEILLLEVAEDFAVIEPSTTLKVREFFLIVTAESTIICMNLYIHNAC